MSWMKEINYFKLRKVYIVVAATDNNDPYPRIVTYNKNKAHELLNEIKGHENITNCWVECSRIL